MDFNVNVNVKFDATPALMGVVSTLAGVMSPTKVVQPAIVVSATSSQSSETKAVVSQEQTPPASGSTAQEQTRATESVSSLSELPAQETCKEITDEMLRKIVGPISKEKGNEAVFNILDGFGVKRVPDLKQQQRQAFIDKLNAL